MTITRHHFKISDRDKEIKFAQEREKAFAHNKETSYAHKIEIETEIVCAHNKQIEHAHEKEIKRAPRRDAVHKTDRSEHTAEKRDCMHISYRYCVYTT